MRIRSAAGEAGLRRLDRRLDLIDDGIAPTGETGVRETETAMSRADPRRPLCMAKPGACSGSHGNRFRDWQGATMP